MPVAAMPELDVEARNSRVVENLGLAGRVAKAYRDRGLDLEDLMQDGAIGLVRAVEKFDPALGYAFSTYATWWIRKFMWQGLTREIAQSGRTKYDPDLQMYPAPEVEVGDDGREDRRRAVVAAVARLAPTDRRLVESVFGLAGGMPRSINALAAEMGVRREYVSRHKRRILEQLRGQLAVTTTTRE